MFDSSRRRLLASLGALALFPRAGFADGATESQAGRFVTGMMADLIAISRQKDHITERISKVIYRHADVRAITNFALGNWRKSAPRDKLGQYQKLAVTYTAITFRTYVDWFEGARFELKSVTPSGNLTLVVGTVTYVSGHVSTVRFKVANAPLRVMDVNVEGIWLSLNLRDSFNRVLARHDGDFDALLAYLADAKN